MNHYGIVSCAQNFMVAVHAICIENVHTAMYMKSLCV